MLKRYLGISLILAGSLMMGCSSSDDDDGSDSPDGSDMPNVGDTQIDGEMSGQADPSTGVVANQPVNNADPFNNTVNVNNSAIASVWLIHAAQGGPAYEVVNNDQIEEPLITNPTDPGGQLNFDGNQAVLLSLVPLSNKLDFVENYYNTPLGNREPSATVNMEVAAGSSSMLVARGAIGDESAPPELIGFAAEPAVVAVNQNDPALAKVRLIHAARNFSITSDIDIYLQTALEGGTSPMGEPALTLTYEQVSSGYLLLSPAVYNVIVTEAGNPMNVRQEATQFNLEQGSVTTLVLVDTLEGDFGSNIEYIPVNDLTFAEPATETDQ